MPNAPSPRGPSARSPLRTLAPRALAWLALAGPIVPAASGAAPGPGSADPARLDAVPVSLRRFVDAAGGDDAATGGEATPWATLGHALERLEPGQTLVMREGVYDEGDLEFDRTGGPGRWTTITAHPGERVIIDASLPDFRNGTDAWESVDPDRGIWRSRRDDLPAEPHLGRVELDDAEAFTLVPYTLDPERAAYGRADFESDVHALSADPRYVGPGTHARDGRLYLRLQRVPEAALHGRDVGPRFDPDPDALDIHLTTRSRVFDVSGSHLRLVGLTLAGARTGVEVRTGAHHVEMRNVEFRIPGSALVMRDDTRDIVMADSLVHGGFPDWIAWTDLKGSYANSRPASHSRFKTAGGNGGFVTRLSVTGNAFVDAFDAMVVRGRDLRFTDNTARVIDDFVQLGSDSSRVEIARNRITGPGPSHSGKGDSDEPGTVWVHHNVIDSTRETLWSRPDPDGLVRKAYHGWHGHRPFPAHTASKAGRGDPWKIYHNTLVFDGSVFSKGAGFQLWDERNDTDAPHEVYNNVFIETAGGPFAEEISPDAGPQVYDGNLYWRRDGDGATLFADVGAGDVRSDYPSLDAFRASADAEASRRWYPPGWEANGAEGDPGLDAELHPLPGGVAASGAVALREGLPGPRPAWRGALAPRRAGTSEPAR